MLFRSSPEVGPAPLVTGPKFDEQHRLKPGAVLRLGESTLQVVPSDSKAKLDHQTAKLPADEYGYWSFLNLHRTDQPHVSLHLQSGLQRLLIEAAE